MTFIIVHSFDCILWLDYSITIGDSETINLLLQNVHTYLDDVTINWLFTTISSFNFNQLQKMYKYKILARVNVLIK